MLSREEAITHTLNVTSIALHQPAQQHTDIYYPGGVPDAVHTDSADYLSVAKICACAIIFHIVSRLPM